MICNTAYVYVEGVPFLSKVYEKVTLSLKTWIRKDNGSHLARGVAYFSITPFTQLVPPTLRLLTYLSTLP